MKLGVGCFDFLVLPEGECWDRRGTLQVVKGVKSEYYHHPEATRINECVVWVVREALEASSPRFNFYYVTEFTGDELRELADRLGPARTLIERCVSADELATLVSTYVRGEVEDSWGPWKEQWAWFRDLTVHSLEQILEIVARARSEQRALLAIGI